MGNSFSFEGFFGDPYRPALPPISGQSALQALNRAEAIDGQRAAVEQSPVNVQARRNMNQLPALFTVKTEVFPADLSQPWPNGQIIWMDPAADGGLPHTRAPSFICLPSNIPQGLVARTLLHERVHVSQKLQSTEWEAILRDAWDMHVSNIALPSSFQVRARINPDTFQAPLFAWKKEWIVFSVFRSLSDPKLTEIDILWWHIPSRTVHREAPPGWKEQFGELAAGEHPQEIAAQLIAEGSKLPALTDLAKHLGKLPSAETM